MSTYAIFNKEIANLMPLWNIKYEVDNSKSKESLGVEYIDTKKSLIDMGNWMLEIGAIKLKKK